MNEKQTRFLLSEPKKRSRICSPFKSSDQVLDCEFGSLSLLEIFFFVQRYSVWFCWSTGGRYQNQRGFHKEAFKGDGDYVFDNVNMTFRDNDNMLCHIYEKQIRF